MRTQSVNLFYLLCHSSKPVEPDPRHNRHFSYNDIQTKKRTFRRAVVCISLSETHRLMRYCTAQFSRNKHDDRALLGPSR